MAKRKRRKKFLTIEEVLLDEMLAYIVEKEQVIASEFGLGESFSQLLADGKVPELYFKIKGLQSDC